MGDAVDLTSGIIVDESSKYYHEGGKLFSRPLPGDEIVISGMAGVFPSSSDISEMRENLFNKVDMVAPNTRWGQWSYDQQEIPSRCGMISGLHKYDAGYFGVHERQGHSMDPMVRIFHEKAIEAILDAGLHPSDLEGTRTGVYVSVYSSENDKAWYYDNLSPQTFAVTGCQRSMIAHRLSYFLKLRGPSIIVDTACSSSFCALENAYRAVRLGEIDNAIVGGTHICLQPLMTLQYLQ
ncbi:fatty acid synthase-like [Anoplophora glabripennis]|uniref:fatty acid synthase-like n=1 Tax=Anoplophora glabripennis TaxID=217634 RepID=UPI000873A9CA|nr:fatty acid synthase-like [Anoplophora glabripennis]